ncbi:MAG: hypothetical protein GY824_04180, partial [Delftia sp.]|nr:hypothetical protein [Delftia sp.]
DSPADLLNLYRHLQAGERARNSAALLLNTDIATRLAALEGGGLDCVQEGKTHDAV